MYEHIFDQVILWYFWFLKLSCWVCSGISYLSRGQESKALRRLRLAYEDESNLKEVRDAPLVKMADTLFTERMKNTFTEWRDGLLRNRNGGSKFQGISNDRQQHLETIFFKMCPALSLNGFTSHQLRLIQLVKYFFHSGKIFHYKIVTCVKYILDMKCRISFLG